MLPERVAKLDKVVTKLYQSGIVSIDEAMAIGACVAAVNDEIVADSDAGANISKLIGSRMVERIANLCNYQDVEKPHVWVLTYFIGNEPYRLSFTHYNDALAKWSDVRCQARDNPAINSLSHPTKE